MQNREILPSEWRTLQFAPLWVFLAVAGADKDINKRELRTLTKQFAIGKDSQEPFVQEIFASVGEEFDDLVPDFAQDNRNIKDGLADVCQVLESKIPSEDSRAFRKALLAIGYDIAEASGPIILGSQSSPEEKAVRFIAARLDTPLEDQTRLTGVKRKRVSRSFQWLMRKIWLIITVSLLVMGCGFLVWYFNLEPGHEYEMLALFLSLFGCLGALVMVFIGLVYLITRQSPRTQVQRKRGFVVLFILILMSCCAAPVAIYAYSIRPPTEITYVVRPGQAVEGIEFPIEIEIINEASSSQMLDSIDLDYETLEIIKSEPPYIDRVEYGSGYSYTFLEPIPANDKLIVTFTGVINQAGPHEIPVAVCIGSNLRCENQTWPIEVVEFVEELSIHLLDVMNLG